MPKCEMRTFSALEVIKGTKAGRGLKSGSMLKNERYSFQVAYKVERQHVRRCSLRAESDISEYITLREEVLSPCSMPVTNKGYVLSYEPTMYPDVLAPYGELGITCRKGLWQASWVTVSGGVPAGVHKLKFALTDCDGNLLGETLFTLNVLDAELEKSDLIYTNWFHYDCLSRVCGEAPFTEEYFAVLENT